MGLKKTSVFLPSNSTSTMLSKLDEMVDELDEESRILDLEENVLFHVIGFIIEEAPLEDGIVLTCKAFRRATIIIQYTFRDTFTCASTPSSALVSSPLMTRVCRSVP